MNPSRLALAVASMTILAAAAWTAAALGPEPVRRWLFVAAGLATIAGVQSVAADPRDLTGALLLSLIPIAALLADGAPTWLVGPLGALLLLAAELGALSWECQGPVPMTVVRRRRLLGILPLATLALAGATAVGAVAFAPVAGGTLALGLAALALVALGRMVLRGDA